MTDIKAAIQQRMASATDPRAYAEILGQAYQESGDLELALAAADRLTSAEDYECAAEAIHYAATDWKEEDAPRAQGGKRWRNVHNPKLVTYTNPNQGGEAKTGEEPAGDKKPAEPEKPAAEQPKAEQPKAEQPEKPQQPQQPAQQQAPQQQPTGGQLVGTDQATQPAGKTREQEAQEFEQEYKTQMGELARSLDNGTLTNEEFKKRTAPLVKQALNKLGAQRAQAVASAAAKRIQPTLAKIMQQVRNPRMAATSASIIATKWYAGKLNTVANDIFDWMMRNAMDMAALASQPVGSFADMLGSVAGSLASPSMAYWVGTMATSGIAWLYFKGKQILRARKFGKLREQVRQQRMVKPGAGMEQPAQMARRDQARQYEREWDLVDVNPTEGDAQKYEAIMILAAQGRAWMLEIAQAIGLDADKVPTLQQLEQRLVIQDVQDYEPFDMDEDVLDFTPEGMGTPVPTGDDNGGYYARRETAVTYERKKDRSIHNAGTLAALLGGHAMGDTAFVPSLRKDRFIRAKVVTLEGDDSDNVQSPDSLQRLVIVDDREGDKHSGHDLYFHWGKGDFDLKDATPIPPTEGPEKLLDLIRQDPPRQEIDESDPMGPEAEQFGRDSYLEGLAIAFLNDRNPDQFAHETHTEPTAGLESIGEALSRQTDVIGRLAEVVANPPTPPEEPGKADEVRDAISKQSEVIGRLAGVLAYQKAAPSQEMQAISAALAKQNEVMTKLVEAVANQKPPVINLPPPDTAKLDTLSEVLGKVAEFAARAPAAPVVHFVQAPPRKVVKETTIERDADGEMKSAKVVERDVED